ncbi:BatA domain-containing protein [Hymenobacter tenuis]
MPSIFFQHATIGWLALLGLAVPLAIYLWNRKPGRVVQVGSLRWLEAAANRRLRSIKPEQLWLFLLRAAIVGLFALALAEPNELLPLPPRRGQVLLGPEVTATSLAPVRPVLDSLRRQGYELRQLQAGQPLGPSLPWTAVGFQDPNAEATPATDTLAAPDARQPLNLWSAVRQAADSLPGRPLVVVATPSLASFSGTRLPLPAMVRWLPLPGPDSLTWPVAAWQPHPDSLVLLVAHGSETGIQLRQVRRRWPATSGPIPGLGLPDEVQIDLAARKLTVTENGQQRALPVLTRPLRLAISFDATHAASANVLAAAVRAAGSVLPLAPRLTVSSALPSLSDSLDWLFWLREAPLPTSWAQRIASQGIRIWQEAPNKTPKQSATSFLMAGSTGPVAILRLDTTTTPVAATSWWPTATGQPLLTSYPEGAGVRYQFRTRLDPAWSALAESPDLPALLLPLLLPSTSAAAPGPDPRLLDLAQLQAGPVAAAAPVSASAPHRDLTPWFVLAAGLLFGAERLLSAYQNRRTAAPAGS